MKSYIRRFWFFWRQKTIENLRQKTYSGTVEKNGARYAITYLLTDTEYASFKSLGLIPANTSEVYGHTTATDSEVTAIAAQGQAEREAIERDGGATQ